MAFGKTAVSLHRNNAGSLFFSSFPCNMKIGYFSRQIGLKGGWMI
ncbi:hypothetical protein SB48_HM08orf01977 [Heyndrickxia coagulans]|uniref:Uncharacterized protein n=1 Tax=Heyndrickxia coagulans TaxID=1398 RepID=A0AAN0WBC8_HEYCO|nr:hypothetical protein SB48_HM08orf01977 [Heyndrickxia coagulans]